MIVNKCLWISKKALVLDKVTKRTAQRKHEYILGEINVFFLKLHLSSYGFKVVFGFVVMLFFFLQDQRWYLCLKQGRVWWMEEGILLSFSSCSSLPVLGLVRGNGWHLAGCGNQYKMLSLSRQLGGLHSTWLRFVFLFFWSLVLVLTGIRCFVGYFEFRLVYFEFFK